STLGIKGIGMSVYPDRYVKDQIWVGAFRRLHRVDAKTRLVTQTFDIEERLGAVWSMTQLTDSSLICGTTSGIFRVFPEDNNIIQLDSTECRYVYQDKQKRLWLSMHEEGLFQWENGERKYVGLNTKNTNPVVKCVFQDQKERIWVATDKGLIHFIPETGKTTHYTRKEGLPNNLVYGILEDQQGYLWLSTNLGLSRFDPENKTFDNFDVQDGLQDNEFNTVSFYGNPQTGELFFGGIKGLNRFFPESLQKNRIPPKMALTDYKRLGKSVKLNTPINQLKTIKLPESEAQMLSFEFVALSLFKGIKNRYSYRLEGINKDWIELGTNNELTLTNITAGNYTLYIRGSNNHGIWTEEPIKIDLKITPPFYKTPLFIFLVVSVILLSAFALYRLRTHRARQQERKLQQQVKTRTLELAQANQAKDKLLALIAHDIRGPLTAFGSIGQQLEYFLNKNRPDRIRELGQHIQGSAKDLNHLLDRLLNWALIQNGMVANQPELLSVKELFDENIGHYQSLLEVNDIRIKREEKSDLQIFGNSNGLHTILRNLIGNAIKYSPNGSQITLRAFKREKRTYIEVQDYGIGMSPKVQEQLFDKHELFTQEGVRGEEGTGLGLLLVIDFVRMNKGNIRIESELEKGTCIYLDFPSTKS
ncbi:MAG: ATP-binding protein, partial [Bacteroidota bacterium]